MKRKILASILALCIMVSISAVAFATEEPDPNPTHRPVTVESDVIPIFGHIGSDSAVIDPEPEIYVEVPLRLVFAAFESEAGVISSPRYTITNLSAISDVKIEIESLTQTNDATVPLNDNLSLEFLTHENEVLLPDLFPSDYLSPKLFQENLPKATADSDDNKLYFMLGGFWSGAFDQDLQPSFDMTVKFSIAQ